MSEHAPSRLFCRPLREGSGSGPAPRWVVSEHEADPDANILAGAAWDELRWTAREGNWIARIESPTVDGFPPVRASYLAHSGRVIELPLLLPNALMTYPLSGTEQDAVDTWESAVTGTDLFRILDRSPNTDPEVTKLYVTPTAPADGTLGDLAWRCIWRASIAVARTIEDHVPSYFVARTARHVAALDAWSRDPSARGGDAEATEAATRLALMFADEVQNAHPRAATCAMSARCFAATESLQSAIMGTFTGRKNVDLAVTIREAVGDDLYLSIAPYGEVRHG